MIPTSLYIKKHNKTGKLYFGKTVSVDPVVYSGSGLYWSRHLNEHGKDVGTVWHKLFTEESDIFEFATFFSEFFDIVNSDDWANLVPETGLDGFPPGGKMPPRSETHKKNWSDSKKGWIPSIETKKIWSKQRTGATVSDRTKELWKKNGRDASCNLDWIITTPDGIEHLVNGLHPWCRENNINFYQVYYQRNGWKAIKNGKGVRSGTKNKRKVYVD